MGLLTVNFSADEKRIRSIYTNLYKETNNIIWMKRLLSFYAHNYDYISISDLSFIGLSDSEIQKLNPIVCCKLRRITNT